MQHRALSAEARGLIASQLVFNIGFYAVMPFLVVILRDDHGQSAAAIGVVLGARTLSQQGLFLVGGALADRCGSRGVIVLGCWVRAVGLWGLLVADGFAELLVSAVVIGLGGALFSPALEARLAHHPARAGVSPFVWLMTIGEVGAALGPLLGAWLLGRGQGASLVMAAILFALMGALLWWRLPSGGPRPRSGRARIVPSLHPGTVLFCLLASGNLLAYNQLYFLYPVVLGAHRGHIVAVLFAVMSALTITTQLPIHRWLSRRARVTAIQLGFTSMAAGFLLVALGGISTGVVIASVVLMGLGHLILTPAHQSQVLEQMRDPHAPGVHLGLLATTGGLAVFVGNWILGAITDLIGAQHPLVWAGLGLWLLIPVFAMPRVVTTSHERNAHVHLS